MNTTNGFYADEKESTLANITWRNLTNNNFNNFISFDNTSGTITVSKDKLSGKDFTNEKNIKIIICVEWIQYSFQIENVTLDSNGDYVFNLTNDSKILLQNKVGSYASPDGSSKPIIEFSIQNAKCLLDENGEYYCDENNTLYYYSEQNPNDQNCFLAKSEGLIKIEGTKDSLVKNLCFENIKFKYGTSNILKNTTFSVAQAEKIYTVENSKVISLMKLDGQIHIDYANNITFNNCEFSSLNSTAIEIHEYAYNINITNNKFMDIGSTAIQIGDFTIQSNRNPLPNDISTVSSVSSFIIPMPSGIIIDNNYIENVGTTYYAGIGILTFYANNVQITHNTIYKIAYTGISLGWGWLNSEASDQIPQSHGDITVEYNIIKDTNKKLIDGAPIYTLGCFYSSTDKQYGCKIKNNYIDTTGDRGDWHGGIYLDEGSEYIYVSNNLILNITKYISARSITSFSSHRIKNSIIEGNYTDATSCDDTSKNLSGTNVIIANNYTGIDINSNESALEIMNNAGYKDPNLYKILLNLLLDALN